ncbi:testis-specific Y-encoded-like protein 2 [Tamandua tetradactyla]|uniref:testis-specific Y-encoded-like protein 2 n=1 Tax=Tamandua tetradactyla TaxID=48850 RepID=UPI004053B32B
MDRPDEGPPTKTRRVSSAEPPRQDPPPPPPPLLRLPLPPPLQRPRLREETEAAQVLADMRGVGLGPTLTPPPPYVILEEGGIRAYFTLGAGVPGWEPAMESGYGGAPPPMESLETLPTFEASGGSLEIDFQDMGPSSLAGEKALETCSAEGLGSQGLAGLKRKEEAVIVVEEEDEDEKEGEKKRRKRKRKQRKRKKPSGERNAKRMKCILQALENIQLDLEAVNIKAGKAFLRLKRKFIQLRRPFLERRDLIIQHIPGFWVKAFLNHPKISMLINQRDEDIFHYLTNLQVQDLRHISMGYKMKLYFQANPYFTNMVIVKEFQRNRSGRLLSHSTPIRWHRGQEPQAHRHKNQDTSHSFFSWFSNQSLPEADMIAEIIKNDLWVNPLRYYMMGEEGYRANRRKPEEKKSPRFPHSKTKKKCKVVIVEDSGHCHALEGNISAISDGDETTDNEAIPDIKISDFMETTDYFETTDNEITDICKSLCDSESPDHNDSPDNNETTDNNESADDESTDNNDNGSPDDNENPDDNSQNPEDNNKNTDDNENPDDNDENPDDNKNPDNNSNDENADDDDKNPSGDDENHEGSNQGSDGNNQSSSDSDNEGDYEGSDDEDNDGNEGDNEGSDDDGNEGDNEGSDDDDRDIEGYENDIEDIDKDQDNSNNQDDEDEVEGISEESVEEDEDNEEGSEQGGEDSEEEEGGDDEEDSDMEEVLQAQNIWVNLGKQGKIG